jgi:hypothetical protein
MTSGDQCFAAAFAKWPGTMRKASRQKAALHYRYIGWVVGKQFEVTRQDFEKAGTLLELKELCFKLLLLINVMNL